MAAPLVQTNAASAIHVTIANIAGYSSNTGNGFVTQRGFQWGTTTSYGTNINTTVNYGKNTAQSWANGITVLSPNTTYHFQAFAVSNQGRTNGSDASFTTQSANSTIAEGYKLQDADSMARGQVITMTAEGVKEGDSSLLGKQQLLSLFESVSVNEGYLTYPFTFPLTWYGYILAISHQVSVLEGLLTDSSSSTQYTAKPSITEGIVSGDTVSFLRKLSVSLAEGTIAKDAVSYKVTIQPTLMESIVLGDAIGAKKTTKPTITESTVANDSPVITRTTKPSVSESLIAKDTISVIRDVILALTEGYKAGDALSYVRYLQLQLTELLKVQDTTISSSPGVYGTVYHVNILESLSVKDLLTVSAVYHSAVSEGVSVQDSELIAKALIIALSGSKLASRAIGGSFSLSPNFNGSRLASFSFNNSSLYSFKIGGSKTATNNLYINIGGSKGA